MDQLDREIAEAFTDQPAACGPAQILMVGGAVDLRARLACLLAERHHRCVCVGRLAEGPMTGIDCYVLDVRLPGKSGIELNRELSASGSRVPVIFITAHDEPAVRDAVARSGAAALLIKPFAGRKLLETLENLFVPEA